MWPPQALDIANLAAVINVDVTPARGHIHRIGRTGRAMPRAGAEPGQHGRDGHVGKIEVLQGAESTWFPLADLTPTGSGPLVHPMATIHRGGRKKIRAGIDVLGALTATWATPRAGGQDQRERLHLRGG